MTEKTSKQTMSNKKLSLIISITYIGLGTIYGLGYWTEYNLTNWFSDFLFDFFMPVSFLLEGILFAESNPFLPAVITQTITFFIIWGITYALISIFRKNKLKDSEKL